jgi:signal transduction histidine kinase
VQLAVQADEAEVRFAVSDTGPGIPLRPEYEEIEDEAS